MPRECAKCFKTFTKAVCLSCAVACMLPIDDPHNHDRDPPAAPVTAKERPAFTAMFVDGGATAGFALRRHRQDAPPRA